MKNIPPFYVGQKVVYITGICMPKNTICKVSYICREDCGCWVMGVNNETPSSANIIMRCNLCGCITIPKANHAFDCNSFRPLQELKAQMLTFEKIKEEEKEEILTLN